MEEEETLKQKLDKIVTKLEEQETKTKKKFKLPWSLTWNKGQYRKRNYAIIQVVKMNGSVDFKKVPIEDNTIKLGEVSHEATADYVLRYKKYPMIILPEWSLKPFSPRENMVETIEEGRLSSAEKFILHRIKMDMIKPKMKWSFGTLFVILAVLVGGFVLLNYLNIV